MELFIEAVYYKTWKWGTSSRFNFAGLISAPAKEPEIYKNEWLKYIWTATNINVFEVVSREVT
jgi:hypothetical protein